MTTVSFPVTALGVLRPIPAGSGPVTYTTGPGRTGSGGVSVYFGGSALPPLPYGDPGLVNIPNGHAATFPLAGETYMWAISQHGYGNSLTESRAAVVPGPGPGPSPGPMPVLDPNVNTFSLMNVSPADVINHPIWFQRPFQDGEIRNTPTIVGLASQWDVLARYPSGCVKRAMCHAVVPRLVRNIAAAFLFANTTAAQAAGPSVSSSALVASIILTRGAVQKAADAKTMFDAGYYTRIYDGPIATTFRLRDDSVARIYDLGFDQYRSARPTFFATYWHGLGKWEVKAHLFNGVGGAMGDVACDRIDITIGVVPYTEGPFVSYWGTWIARTGWVGGAPEEMMNFDHNLGWLANATKVLGAPYDPTFSSLWTEPMLVIKYTQWQNAHYKGLNEPGLWAGHMGDPGGRADIGTDPGWYLDWLFSRGDWRMKRIALDQAYRAGGWRWTNFIEGDPTVWFDKAKTVRALGKPPSIFGRPNEYLGHNVNSPFWPHDEGIPHVPYTLFSWQSAHEPNCFAIPYLLTGCPLLLEAMQIWAACDEMSVPVNTTPTQIPYYGLTLRAADIGGWGSSSTRGCAWSENIGLSAEFLSTDNTPEKAYLKAVNDARFGVDFGLRGFTSLEYAATPAYQYGVLARNSVKSGIALFSPIGWWQSANLYVNSGAFFKHGNTWNNEPWQNCYKISTDGKALDYGYPVQVEIDTISKPLKMFFAESQADPVNVDPKWFGAYVAPVAPGIALNPAAPMFTTQAQTWAEVVDTEKAQRAHDFIAGATNLAPLAAKAAATFCKKSDPLWQWIMANVRNDSRWDHVYLGEPHLCVSPRQ